MTNLEMPKRDVLDMTMEEIRTLPHLELPEVVKPPNIWRALAYHPGTWILVLGLLYLVIQMWMS